MQLLKNSKPRSSSANVFPASTPPALDSPTSYSPSPLSLDSSKSANKSFWPESRKSFSMRLPSLPRRSRSKSEFTTTSDDAAPVVARSPSRKSNANKNLLDGDGDGAVSSSQAIRAENGGKHAARGGSFRSSSSKAADSFEEEIRLVFEKFDTNGDGKISAEELCCVLRSLGDDTTQEEAELMIAEVDADKDGFIDLQEFINLNSRASGGGANGAEHSRRHNVTDELAAAFDMFDLDKNGCITPDELHHVLGKLGNRTSTLEDCRRMIHGVDRKGSGHVDFDDFKIMMTSSNSIMA